MSRFGDDDWYDEDFPNQSAFWSANAERALKGKKGRKALAELREALQALPEKRLISGALCTVDVPKRTKDSTQWYHDDLADNVGRQGGEGVCAIGAFLWFKQVKAGADPKAAFDALPTLIDSDGDSDYRTAREGERAGMTYSLASSLAYRNDMTYEGWTPEERYEKFMAWLDSELGVLERSDA